MGPRFDLGWAIVRFWFGAQLAIHHGYAKVFEGKVEGLVKTVAELGFPAPHVFAWCAGLSEFVGGILLALGLLTRPAAAAVAFTMSVALYRHGSISEGELASHYWIVALVALLVGGGKFSLDSKLKIRLPFTRRG